MRDIEAETQAEGEASFMQGACHETPSRISRITPWDEGGAKPLSHPGCPSINILNEWLNNNWTYRLLWTMSMLLSHGILWVKWAENFPPNKDVISIK